MCDFCNSYPAKWWFLLIQKRLQSIKNNIKLIEKSTATSIWIKVAEKPRQEVGNRIQNGVSRSEKIDFRYKQSLQGASKTIFDLKMSPKCFQNPPIRTLKWHQNNVIRTITTSWSSRYDSHHLIIMVWPSWYHHRDMITDGLNRKTFLTQAPDRFRRS